MKSLASRKKPITKYNPFSGFWRGIFLTRLGLCAIVGVFTFLDQNIAVKARIYEFLVLYIAFNLLLGLIDSSTLQLKRVRFIPDAVDVFFISLIVYYTGPGSSWFIFYLFPIASVARYLGDKGSIFFAVGSALIYFFLYAFSNLGLPLDHYSFILRVLSFVGVASVAGNLAKSRLTEEMKLIKVSEEVNDEISTDIETEKVHDEISTNIETEKVHRLLLKKALEFTTSEMGHIRLINSKTGQLEIVAAIGHPDGYNWELRSLDDSISNEVIKMRKPKVLHSIIKKDLAKRMGTYFRLHRPRPRSALFVPLIEKSVVVGVIAVYSRKRFHYTKNEIIRLGSFSPLIIMSRKTIDLYKDLVSAARERKERLTMLYEFGERLKTNKELKYLFEEVVKVTIERLNSEEAALFLPEDEHYDRISKVAVRGPNDEISKRLNSVEKSYSSGESLAGETFLSKTAKHINSLDQSVKYVDVYEDILPSKQIRHYIAVPLLVGEEIVGVIRVINKKSRSYSLEKKNFRLSDVGFDDEDFELMQTIGSQVSVAVHHARLLDGIIKTEKYLENLIINSPDPIIALDEEGRVKTFNRACEDVWGYKYKDVEGKSVEDLYESKAEARKIGGKLWEKEDHRIENFPARIKDNKGRIIQISLSASFLFNEKGSRIGSIGVFKDLRDVERLQDQVLQAEQLAHIGRLAHSVGHDIKHKIGAALAYIGTLQYECRNDGDDEKAGIYTEIRDVLWEAVEMFQNMLIAAKPKEPQMIPVNIDNIFYELRGRLTRQAGYRNIQVSVNKSMSDETKVFVDTGQIQQVFFNLFNNSIDAIEKKRDNCSSFTRGVVEISVKSDNGYLRISWRDNGCGIPREFIQHIFNPFYTNKKSGSGLGLFNVKAIIENHGGQISVTSEEGENTVFVIDLPLKSVQIEQDDFTEAKRYN